MLTHVNNSDTLIIVLHEIYGLNRHISGLCKKLAKHKYDIMAPDLLQGRGAFRYDQEELAYQHFMEHIGFEGALSQLRQIIANTRPHYRKICVLGYSIGATLAWLSSTTGSCDAVVGFYGSRIRDYLAAVPQCPVLLFFAAGEKSVAVDEVLERLNSISQVRARKLPGSHGFADPFSSHYHQGSSRQACRESGSFLQANLQAGKVL